MFDMGGYYDIWSALRDAPLAVADQSGDRNQMHMLGARRKRDRLSDLQGSRQPSTRHQMGTQLRTRPIDLNGDGDAVAHDPPHDALADRIHGAAPDVQLEVLGSNSDPDAVSR